MSYFNSYLFEPKAEPPKSQFRIIGIVSSPEFQICRCYVERLFRSFPHDYAEPDIRPVLDVEWHLFLIKVRRKIGGEKLWALEKQVAIFKDGEFLGDDADLSKFIVKKYKLSIIKDFDKIGQRQLVELLTKQSELGVKTEQFKCIQRNFFYLTIAVDDRVIGSMLFHLYSDLVPLISEIFLRRCVRKRGGYAGTPVQRIAIPSWIQCGGWHLKHCYVPCENYVVPHDRRGVLSMCHNGKHTDNSTQFFITLGPASWMDYKYVAFGQLIHGEEILRTIEKIPTNYEIPQNKVQIVKAGEFNFYPSVDPKDLAELMTFLAKTDPNTKLPEDIIDPRDVASVLLRARYKKGLYSAATDLQSYLPFLHLPDYLIYKCVIEEELRLLGDGGEEEYYGDGKMPKELLQHMEKEGSSLNEELASSRSAEPFIKDLVSDIVYKSLEMTSLRSEDEFND